jgi:hypothetical protein
MAFIEVGPSRKWRRNFSSGRDWKGDVEKAVLQLAFL